MIERPMEKLSFTVAEAVSATGLSKSTIFAEIKEGRLETRKRGSTTLILRDELARYLGELPKGRGE
jgi:excisionase family DNA binding protein